MAKALRTAAIIVGAVAVAVGTAGVLAPGATAGALSAIGITASASSVAAGLSAASAALSLGAGLVARKPTAQATGSQVQFSADPDAGIPWILGIIGQIGFVQWRAAA